MADIGTAYVRIAPNMSGIQGKIAAGFKGAGAEATRQLGNEVDSNSGPFQKAIGNLGNIAKTGGKVIAAGMGLGIAGVAALTGKMLMSGAEFEQQLGGSEAVFGNYAKNIQNIALTSFNKMGLSQNEFLQGANKMGALYQGSGFSVKESMDMSAKSIQLAADTASIMGLNTTDALEAVTAMAKGNFTMMDNLGVKMDDTTIQAYAMSKGIKGASGALSAQEKVGLATQLFLETNAKYAGNYAKENDTLAGSLNTTKKAFADFLSGGNTIDNFIGSLVNTIKIAIPQITAILPQLVDGIDQTLQALVPALSAALPVLVPALINAVTGLLRALVDALPGIVQVIVDALPVVIGAFIEIFLGIVKALPEIVQILAKAMPIIIDALVTGLTNPEALTAIIMGTVQLLLALVQAIPIILPALVKAIPIIIQNIVTTLTSPVFIRQLIGAGIELFKAFITGIYQTESAVGAAIYQMYNIVKNALSFDSMKSIGGSMIQGLWQGISGMQEWIIGKIKGFSGNILGGIKSFFGIHSPSTVFAGIGTDLNRGLAQGIDSSASLVSQSVNDMSNQALSAIGATGINPSYSVAGVSAGQPASALAGGNITNIQNVNLGDAGAVKEFFKQLNQDTITAGLGITPVQGATI